MFDIGWSELVVIGVVALIAIGPKELPGVLRMAGQWIGKVRRMAAEFQGQFQEALREAEMEDLKKQVNEITDSARDLTNFDPLEHVQSELDSSFDAIRVDDPATPVDTGHMAPSDYSSTSAEPPAISPSETSTPAPAPPEPQTAAPSEAPDVPKAAAGGHSS
jgi:sec-independent protein translocase protein TatB